MFPEKFSRRMRLPKAAINAIRKAVPESKGDFWSSFFGGSLDCFFPSEFSVESLDCCFVPFLKNFSNPGGTSDENSIGSERKANE